MRPPLPLPLSGSKNSGSEVKTQAGTEAGTRGERARWFRDGGDQRQENAEDEVKQDKTYEDEIEWYS